MINKLRALAQLILKVQGKEEFRVHLDIANRPKTVNEILRVRKISVIILDRGDYYMFKLPIRVGPEKPASEFSEGDVAFDYMGSWVLIFKKNSRYILKANPIGKVAEKVPNIKSGSQAIVETEI